MRKRVAQQVLTATDALPALDLGGELVTADGRVLDAGRTSSLPVHPLFA